MEPTEAGRRQREELGRSMEELARRGICYQCYNLQTGDLFGDEHIVYKDDLFKVVLEPYPCAQGHTIVVYKSHREDISELSEEEAGRVFGVCVRVVRAIKEGLGAEKVYLLSLPQLRGQIKAW